MSRRKTRKIDSFLEVAPDQRLNPNSVRRLLFQFIEDKFEKDCVSAAAALSEAPREPGQERFYQKPFSDEVLYNLTRDNRQPSYKVLDAFARYHGIPVSLVLLFTRIHSELDDPSRRARGRHLTTINAFKEALSAIEEAAIRSDPNAKAHEEFNYELFFQIAEVYRNHDSDNHLPF